MDIEETENIDQLLDKASSEGQQKTALKRLGEMLEESYILNLPPSKVILQALQAYAKRSQVPSPLANRAKKLYAQYKI